MESIEKIKCRAKLLRKKSKALLAYTVLTLAASSLVTKAEAQTFAEWFSQKKTQKKYLLQQIAALQVYTGYLRNGYQIAQSGLGSISKSISNEFNLHGAYYNKLKTVNHAIKKSKEVADILDWQKEILGKLADLKKIDGLNNDGRNYVKQVRSAVLKYCNKRFDELSRVINDSFSMSDEERLSRINVIHTAMADIYQFCCLFSDEVSIYIIHTKQGTADNESLKRIFQKH